MSQFPVDGRSKANRYADRANYDKSALANVLAACVVVHVSFLPPGNSTRSEFPSVLPMLGAYDAEHETIYLHGSSAAHLMKLTSSAGEEGLAVTIAATITDGIVLALSPFSHSFNYRSAVIFGRATLLTDPGEINDAFRLITDRVLPGRWDGSRVPPTASEIRQTGVLRVRVETASVKVRKGAPHSERRDLKDPDVVGRVWEGVVPVFETLGEPVPSEGNGVDDVPGYIARFVEGENGKRRGYAEGNAVDQ